jgi:precorrin-3B synthase
MLTIHHGNRPMNGSASFEVKGWCPGALRPMLSGDGLIVRLRPWSGMLSPEQSIDLADAARRFGNGHIDLTRRANLQIRGVSEASLPQLHELIERLGLLDDSPDGEAVRNVMINPLAGIDPTEALDIRSIASELSRLLASETSIWALPAKFGFIVDGGGALALAGQRADVRLAAIGYGPDAAIAIGLERRIGLDWLGSISPGAAAAAALETGLAFIAVASREGRQRMRDLSDQGVASIRAAMRLRLDALCENPRQTEPSLNQRIGLVELGTGRFAVGIAAPFGRVEADQLGQLAEEVATRGIKEIRLSPWRALYAMAPSRQSAQRILDTAEGDGWIVDPRDPLLQIEACPGAPGCRSTSLDTRGDGRRLAGWLPRFGFAGTVHISGCAKGCAKSGPADLVLVGADGRYGIVRNATAGDRPARSLSLSCRRSRHHLLRSGPRPRVMTESYTYIRDGAEIYRNSFAIIRAEADLSRFKDNEEKLVVRMIHACGMIDIADDIVMSPEFAACASTALRRGAPILCDAKMVAHGITRNRLPQDNRVICTLDDPAVADLAAQLENTRSAAAVELWRPQLEGAVVAIGNAPTSLFRLLEMLDTGAPLPAAIIGVPVGFVGAAESKQALAAQTRVPFLVVRGRRGGSAMAAAAVNALASERE